MRQGHLFVAFVLFLLAIPVSVVLIISFAEILERRSRSSPTVYLLALVAHAVLAVMFFRFTAGQAMGRIWWGLEIVVLAALTALVSAPRVRRLTRHLSFSHFDSLDSRPRRTSASAFK
jgi:chromate transport protein ChrA